MDYVRARATAQRIIKKNGRLVTWRQFPAPSTAAQGWTPDPTGAHVDFSPYVAFLTLGTANPSMAAMIAALDVPTGSTQALLAGNDEFVPTLNDVCITVDEYGQTETLRVTKLETLRPAEIAVLHTMILSR
jgi:hypothetical protein